MIAIKSKKAFEGTFLVGLIFLMAFVVLIMLAASKSMTDDSKYIEFDTQNIGLFIERIPSIEGNFHVTIDLLTYKKTESKLDIEFFSDTIKVDISGIKNKRSQYSYKNPEQFQIGKKDEAIIISNITTLHIYKTNNEITILNKSNKELDKQIKQIPKDTTSNIESVAIFNTKLGKTTELTSIKHTNQQLSDLCKKDITKGPKENFIWIPTEQEASNDEIIEIHYNLYAVKIAYELYNRLQKTEATIKLIPIPINDIQAITNYKEKCIIDSFDTKPIIITKAKSNNRLSSNIQVELDGYLKK